ncbi:MAG: hypothetical protein COU27_03495, partial [Candidatus Levybacteria bacterium CG10_big_fil_rev_8_21_14_0_10_36_7]
WDITTNARPEQIMATFPETFYENDFGTVGVVNKTTDETLRVVEITPYRLETTYSDNRRPDKIEFSPNLEDDLKRRDFTINAIALKIEPKDLKKGLCKATIIDLYGGIQDLHKGIIRSVGDPNERFGEDALRVLRAVRIATEIDFKIEDETKAGILNNAKLLKNISPERIRDEFIKIISSERPMEGIQLVQSLCLMGCISPEIEQGIGVNQNQAHAFDVWEHLLRTLQYSAKKEFSLEVRLSALFHDIGKPASRRWSKEKKDWTFHGHDVIGAKITAKIMAKLRFPAKITDKVVKLVRWHMFFSDTEVITLSAVRRMVMRVGPENIWDLMNLRACDRIGTGRPKESPYRLRKYHSMIEEAMRDPVSVTNLKIDGKEIMEKTGIKPGPKIGFILNALLEEVLEDATRNKNDWLSNRVLELSKLTDKELEQMGKKAKSSKEKREESEINTIRKKYWVK